MTIVQSIDDKINGIMPTEPEIQKETEHDTKEEVSESSGSDIKETESREINEKQEKETESDKEHSNSIESSEDTDEYGNKVEKARIYTEDEVQRMIRDRLSRGQHSQPQQQSVQQAASDFQADPNNPDDWQVQLESFVKNTIDKVGKESQERAFQEEKNRQQADFESKFTTGMEKYKDFREVVSKVPITDAMMRAASAMKDPAAFIYAAAKNQGKEIERIARLTDPYHQAREIGELHANMKKVRNISQTAKPLSPTKGDMPAKYEPKRSIDALIQQHAKSRRR